MRAGSLTDGEGREISRELLTMLLDRLTGELSQALDAYGFGTHPEIGYLRILYSCVPKGSSEQLVCCLVEAIEQVRGMYVAKKEQAVSA